MNFSFCGDEEFDRSNIRCNKELEPLGALGDLGIYCVRFAMFVYDWCVPISVYAHSHGEYDDGVIRTITCTMEFGEGRTATFTSSFEQQLQQRAVIGGEKISVIVDDFVLPGSVEDPKSCYFTVVEKSALSENDLLPVRSERRIRVDNEKTQEVS